MKRLRDSLPAWLPLVGVDLGDTNVVPVDYVAKAMDHLAHLPGRDGEAFHLVNPEPQPVVEVVNLFCAAAGGPAFATPVDRSVTRAGPLGLVPRALRPASSAHVRGQARRPRRSCSTRPWAGSASPPRCSRTPASPRPSTRGAPRRRWPARASPCPTSSRYARTLWGYWEEHLDTSTGRDAATRAALQGKYVVITGASSGIGQVTALKVAQAGGVPVLVARGKDKLEETRADDRDARRHGVRLPVRPLRPRGDRPALRADHQPSCRPSTSSSTTPAARSAGRCKLSHDRFHDFERTMQLNYFGAIRLVMGLVPAMREQQRGHIVNISSIGVQTNPPRFSAYVASKAALDSWSNVVASELVGDGITFTSIHMPLVRTPMIAPTKLYDKFPTISPAQAADLVIKAMVERPHEINTHARQRRRGARTPWPRRRRSGCSTWPTTCSPTRPPPRARTPRRARASRSRSCWRKVFKGVHW